MAGSCHGGMLRQKNHTTASPADCPLKARNTLSRIQDFPIEPLRWRMMGVRRFIVLRVGYFCCTKMYIMEQDPRCGGLACGTIAQLLHAAEKQKKTPRNSKTILN